MAAKMCLFGTTRYSQPLDATKRKKFRTTERFAGVVRDGLKGFLIPPGDEDFLAERLSWLLKHPAAAQQMGRRGRKLAAYFFSPQRFVEGYRQVLTMVWSASGSQTVAEGQSRRKH